MQIILRAEAKSLGLKRYFTGKPCKHGHNSERYAANGHCAECHSNHNVVFNEKNKDYYKERYEQNKDSVKERSANWAIKNKERAKEIRRKSKKKYAEKNNLYSFFYSLINKEEIKKKRRLYRISNLRLFRFKESRHRSIKKNRTASWANIESIKKIYIECPINFHVDHIVPLKGKTVSGLHCEANLQYLTKSENLRKGNRWWPDMWE